MGQKNSAAILRTTLEEAIPAVGGRKKETERLVQTARRILPGWERSSNEQVLKASQAFRELVGRKPSPYDGPANRQRLWKQCLFAIIGVDMAPWQFVCPPKITLGETGWVVEEDPKYDILTGSLESTKDALKVLSTAGLKYNFNLFYPDDEILKARASGLKLSCLPQARQRQLKNELVEISLEQCIEIQDRLRGVGQVVLWSDAAVELGLNLDKMFEEELLFWKQKGEQGIGFFRETQAWLEKAFGFNQQLSFELTARRLAKYATEGRVLAKMFPFGSIYLNNEFPFNEPWAMYTAALTPEERDTMAVLFYL